MKDNSNTEAYCTESEEISNYCPVVPVTMTHFNCFLKQDCIGVKSIFISIFVKLIDTHFLCSEILLL